MSLCYIGSQNETQAQIDKLLNFNKSTVDVSRENALLKKSIKKTKKSGKLVTLNQIYVHSNEENMLIPNKNFENLMEKYYRSFIECLDFSKKNEALYLMNNWIGRKTRDKLKYLIEDCDLNPPGIILINATYFCGRWKIPFIIKNTKPNVDFTMSNGNIEKVDMMHQYNVEYKHSENVDDLKASVCVLPYEGNLSLMIILPHKDINIAFVESKFNLDTIKRINEQVESKRVNIAIPIFKLHIKTEVLTFFFNSKNLKLNFLFSFLVI